MRRLILSTMLVAGALAGCDDGGTADPTDVDPVGSDMGADMDGADMDPADMAEPEAPFNYIPLNDEACAVETKAPGVQQIAGEALLGLVQGGEHRIAAGLKLCDEEPIAGCDFTCTGEQNPLLQLGRDFDGPLPPIVADAATFAVPMGLASYFEQALAYPYRELVVSYVPCADLPAGSCPPGTDVQVVLTQGRQQRCDGETAGCDLYSIEPESLDLACERFPLTLYSAVEGDLAGEYALSASLPAEAIENGVTFGLAVPLVDEFPANGAALTEEELLAWLEQLDAAQQTLSLRLQDYAMEIRVSADGTVCGRASGRLPVDTFVDALGIEDADRIDLVRGVFGPYADADDLVTGQFTFALEPARITTGMPCHPDPCVTTEAMCGPDELLMTTTTRDRCWLDAGDGAVAEPLATTCVERAERIVEHTVDCAALGGTCSPESGCGVDYEAPEAGDLVFTELFVGDGVGQTYDGGENTIADQWVELYNASDRVLDLDGCVLRSGPIDGFRVSVLQPNGPIPVAPGARIVLAYSDDPAVSGLASSAYAYGFPVGMGRDAGSDRIALYCGTNGSALIDDVQWADGWGINADAASMQLNEGVFDAVGNDDIGAWCPSAGDPFAEGRLGSPGAANAACP